MSVSLLDIHTHHSPLVAGTALVNCYPEKFFPQEDEYYSVGIHPWFLQKTTPECWVKLREAVLHPQTLAVGEAGLDKVADTSLEVQIDAFKRQVQLAEEVGKPLLIHLVKATAELLQVQRELRPKQPWIIHGFRGKSQQACELLRHGFYLSLGEHFQKAALQIIPIERLFLESDESECPIEELYAKVAFVRGLSVEELKQAIQKNVNCLFVSSQKVCTFAAK